MTRYFVRFTKWQRAQHAIVIVLFVLLCVTGLPQKYFESGWAAGLIRVMGGVDTARWLHRASGLAFAGLMVAHVVDLLLRLARGTASPSMVPHLKDVRDALTTLRYYVGMSDRQPRFDRFDYKQKFEYWGSCSAPPSSSSPGSSCCFRSRSRPGCPARSFRLRSSRTAARACSRS